MGRDVNKADLTGVRTAKQPSRETMTRNASSEGARHGFVPSPVEVLGHLLLATAPIIVFISIGSYEAKSDYSAQPYRKLYGCFGGRKGCLYTYLFSVEGMGGECQLRYDVSSLVRDFRKTIGAKVRD